jgi:hypothetical protein
MVARGEEEVSRGELRREELRRVGSYLERVVREELGREENRKGLVG